MAFWNIIPDSWGKDALIHRYETAPSIVKVRRYVLSTLLFAFAAGVAGFASDGEMKRTDDSEEEE